MMRDESENGLTGQYNLAQGNPPAGGDALGLESGHENRPRKDVHKRENLNSDEINLSFFMGILSFLSVRKKLFAFFSVFTRTVFLLHPIPRAAFQFVPSETLPWAMIFWPFRPEKMLSSTCV